MKQTLLLSSLVYLLFLLLLPLHPESMFTDPDTWWHLAAGEFIRATGTIPGHDPWSFTAGDQRWLNISWAWDVGMSYLYQHFGWHGIIAINSMTIALTMALIFSACMLRSGHGIASLLVTILVWAAMLGVNVRSYQVSYIFTALLVLLLPQIIRGTLSKCWLALIPAVMVIWINMHGGFYIGFFMLGIYGAETWLRQERQLTYWLLATGIVSLFVCLLNPYGIDILASLHTLKSISNEAIDEWQPLTFSIQRLHAFVYIVPFIALVMMRPGKQLTAEKIIAYTWLIMAAISVRHLSIFAIVSAPLLAKGLADDMLRNGQSVSPKIQSFINDMSQIMQMHWTKTIMMMVALCSSLWLFAPSAAAMYGTASYKPVVDLSEEIAFIEQHYPHARFLNRYEFGGVLIFQAKGKIPVFIDGRAETAYPKQVLLDYMAFLLNKNGWEEILNRYHIDGVIIFPDDPVFTKRFVDRPGWHLAFKGKTAAIFMRDRL